MSIWYDFFTIMIIFAGMVFGFNWGMVRQIVSVVGLYFGLVFASYFHVNVSRLARNLLGEADTLTRDALLFFLVFALIWALINAGLYFSYRHPPRFLPAALDRTIGALLGGLTGVIAAVVITLLLSYATDVPWPQNNGMRLFLQSGIESSFLQPLFLGVIPALAASIEPWLPRGLPAFFTTVGP